MNYPKTIVFLCVLALLLPLYAAESRQAAAGSASTFLTDEPYTIGPGDILGISVWKDEALSQKVTVLPDNTISFPLIGQIVAGGKTVPRLKAEIEDRIKDFVPDPKLSLMVHEVNSMFIYVIGKVTSPGRFKLNESINVMQALALAGGLTPFADEDKIVIFRKTKGGEQLYNFHYGHVSKGKDLKDNIMLKKGDVIVVP